MNLHKQLVFYLEQRGITASELARRAGLSKQLISLWMAGSIPKNILQVKRAADVLGVSIDNLIFGTGLDSNLSQAKTLESLLGNDWVTGVFEIRIRRVKAKDHQ